MLYRKMWLFGITVVLSAVYLLILRTHPERELSLNLTPTQEQYALQINETIQDCLQDFSKCHKGYVVWRDSGTINRIVYGETHTLRAYEIGRSQLDAMGAHGLSSLYKIERIVLYDDPSWKEITVTWARQ